jgi:hypothetical protein
MGAAKIRKKNGTYFGQPNHVPSEPTVGTVGGYRYTESQYQEFIACEEAVVAIHESSHAVAAFLLKVPIQGMSFYSPEHPRATVAVAVVEAGLPEPEMLAKSTDERWVHGCEHAFISLAGVYGCSREGFSENPFHKRQRDSHIDEASSNLYHIGCVPTDEINVELVCLLGAVIQIFNKPIVQEMVRRLANEFLNRRKLDGAEIKQILQQVLESGISEESGRAL